MYSYNSMPGYNQNMYYRTNNYNKSQDGDRLAGGLLAPLFLGGVAGYAIGYNRPNNNYPYPYPYAYPYPVPVYYNNYPNNYYPYY